MTLPTVFDCRGVTIELRRFDAHDRDELTRGFAHLSADSRRHRFLESISQLRARDLDALCAVDGKDHLAVVAVELDDLGRERKGVGIARCIRESPTEDVAEVAVTVIDEWQGCGIGCGVAREIARTPDGCTLEILYALRCDDEPSARDVRAGAMAAR